MKFKLACPTCICFFCFQTPHLHPLSKDSAAFSVQNICALQAENKLFLHEVHWFSRQTKSIIWHKAVFLFYLSIEKSCPSQVCIWCFSAWKKGYYFISLSSGFLSSIGIVCIYVLGLLVVITNFCNFAKAVFRDEVLKNKEK